MPSAALLRAHRAAPQDPAQLAAQARAETALLRAMGHVYRAVEANRTPVFALRSQVQRAGEDFQVMRSLLSRLTRGEQGPATTDDPDWAGALARPPMVEPLVDLLAGQGNVAALLPLTRFTLDGNSLAVPFRAPGGVDLAAAFRGEGQPIRIGKMSLSPCALTPKSMGVICTSTREMLKAAGPGVMDAAIGAGVIYDTSRTLDGLLFGDQAGDAVTPAGLASLATGANTAASTGTDAASISADLKARLAQLLENGYGGPSTRWVMNTLSAATLAQLFTETQMHDTFLRVPIVAGPGVPQGVVFLIDCAGVAFGADDPMFDSTTETVIHEEGDPGAVLPIVDGGVAATPVRSLFQTNAMAIRMVWPLDWAVGGAGAVQTLTGVTW